MLSDDPLYWLTSLNDPLYSLTSLNGDVGEMNKKIVHFSGAVVVLDCAEPDQGQQSMFVKQKIYLKSVQFYLPFDKTFTIFIARH